MANPSSRQILSFFNGNSRSVSDAAESLSALYPKAEIDTHLAGRPDSNRRPASKLRLPGESILSATLPVPDLGAAIQILQSQHARSIFLTGALGASGGSDDESGFDTGLDSLKDVGELLKTLTKWERAESESCEYLQQSVSLGHLASPAAQWVLDNAFLVRLGIKDIRAEVRSSLKQMPIAQINELIRLAEGMLHQSANRITDELVRDALQEVQAKCEWNSQQLWSFPLALRVVLIGQLVSLSRRCSRMQQLREEAFLWADRITHSFTYGQDVLSDMIDRMESQTYASDRSFVVALAEQLQEQETPFQTLQNSIESRLGACIPDLVRAEHQRESEDSLHAANAFGSLRTIGQIKFRDTFEAVSRVHAELRLDPSGIYTASDFTTRDRTRQVIAALAKRAHIQESEVAHQARELARASSSSPENSVLFYLLGDGIALLESSLPVRPSIHQGILRRFRRFATPLYIGSMIGFTACFTLVALNLAWDAGIQGRTMLIALGMLAALPLSELALQTVNSLVIAIFPPEFLPKLDLHESIPTELATLAVVPMMLSDLSTIEREVEKLEIRFLANRIDQITFALFSDFTDAKEEKTESDARLLSAAKEGIAALNRKYDENRFVLFHRARSWSESEQCWIGRERKRGKIEDLNAFLCGAGNPKIVAEGVLTSRIRYVITLDADTQLPPGTALRMIETIAHPMNQVEIDPKTGIRRRGYTIIQPRVSIALPGASTTRFTQIFSDAQGTDPYSFVVSDAHQELFAEATFQGKAIYDVAAFHRIVGERFPAETLLSHDLIEGAHCGVGLASDIEVLENLPADYPAFARRQHRWVRGDWQIAAWVTGRVPCASGPPSANPLSAISRWRILDNLRRSIVPIASMLLLAFGWFVSSVPGIWTIVLGLAVVTPALVPVLDRWSRHVDGTAYGWRGAADDLRRAVVNLAFLPHQAWINADAIIRALHRTRISRRNTLEWQTAADDSKKHSIRDATFRQLVWISCCSAVGAVVLAYRGDLGPTFLFLALWIGAPLLMRRLAEPVPQPRHERLGREDNLYLRRVSRLTWRYFDDLVGESSNWLPPDNSQVALRIEVAQRTSPTNIGLWLNSAQAARDFGYISTDEFVRRCSATFDTLDRLERYEGHLLNWYDTKTLAPLPPKYISTVDSGNLIASLWVTSQGCDELRVTPILQSSLKGITDLVAILSGLAGEDPSLSAALNGILSACGQEKKSFETVRQVRLAVYYVNELRHSLRWKGTGNDEREYWTTKLIEELESWERVANRYLRWMEVLSEAPDQALALLGQTFVQLRRDAMKELPSLAGLAGEMPVPLQQLFSKRAMPELRPELATWLDTVSNEYNKARYNAQHTIVMLQALAGRANQLASEINMAFLYDPARRLFGTGYTLGTPATFSSHYDLLASECRLGSLVAIAKGEIPVEHWFVLGRPRIATPSRQALLSWSGTMFEYLMPLLFTEAFDNSLLAEAAAKAVQAQIAFGAHEQIPWGISESAYSALDSNQIYQYRAFGIPDLALSPDAEAGPVVAPYATALALMVDPKAALSNLQKLEKAGAAGTMGFYDSIDYTREQRGGKPGVVIYTYMVHHQAMTLLALNNTLNGSPFQRRFHHDARIRAVESLLCERIPIERVEAEEVFRPAKTAPVVTVQERVWTSRTALPHVHLNSNGRYSLMITNNGGGYSRWNGIDLTRWRSDTARDAMGPMIWIRDERSARAWPVCSDQTTVTFTGDHAEFRRQKNEVGAKLEVTVATEEDVELRRVTLVNRSASARDVELTSYMELSLAKHAADCSHPAFAKMFVVTEAPEMGVLIAHRRPRSEGEDAIWVASLVVGSGTSVEYETDRAAFIGRGRDPGNPIGLSQPLGCATGAVLDPAFAFRVRCKLEARRHSEVTFLLMAASSREELERMIRKYRGVDAIAHTFEMAWTRAQLEFRYLRIGSATAHRFEELAGHLLYPNSLFRANAARLARSRGGQADLWKHGISGDLPIILATAADTQAAGLIRELILAQSYLRMRGLAVDLVILNQEDGVYQSPVRDLLARLLQAQPQSAEAGGKVYSLHSRSISETDRELLFACAPVVLGGHLGPLQQQLLRSADSTTVRSARKPRVVLPAASEASLPAGAARRFANGIGGFEANGQEYGIDISSSEPTPAPWSNVISNENFGTVVTESGLGFTWFGNSQRNRLTPWHNDPVSDPQSEIILIRDPDSGMQWTPTVLPWGGNCRVHHGQGYSRFEQAAHEVATELTVFVARDQPVKLCLLTLRNSSIRSRRLTLTHYVEWVLGSVREQQQLHVKSRFDETQAVMLAQQTWNPPYEGFAAFTSSSPSAVGYTGDRISFQRELLEGQPLDKRTGGGLDPCSALQVQVTLTPGGSTDVVFVLGQAETDDLAVQLAQRFRNPADARAELSAVQAMWDQRLGVIQVATPSSSIDPLLNRWLLYQSLSCRFWGRSAFYQSGGAFGFRDQLQDCIALCYSAPQLARAHILKAAARQFTQGDVQHWWHDESGLGVRTRCSDDMLWLPWAVTRYVERTDDAAILQQTVPFLEGAELTADQHDQLFTPAISNWELPIWEHCRLAIDRACRFGSHLLPLMGDGDWNDGMNLVGAQGRGESVWLAWFLLEILKDWVALAQSRDRDSAERWETTRVALRQSVEAAAWDGEWYLRGFFDDGSALGSKLNPEARIDAIAQAWSVLSGQAVPERAAQALQSAERHLVHQERQLIQLLTPPFDKSVPHPGYIMGYPPGVRENGGQYTHGALWLAQAHARSGNGEAAVRLLQMMNPVERTKTIEGLSRYRGEPYAVAADVSFSPGREGQSGWTWYTGSAGWMYRIWLEDVLGFQLRGARLRMVPAIPASWPGFQIQYRYHSTAYKITVTRSESTPVTIFDGKRTEQDGWIDLIDDGAIHQISVTIAAASKEVDSRLTTIAVAK